MAQVEIEKLELNPEGTELTLKAHVKEDDYLKDVFLNSIYIDTENTFVEGKPSETPVFKYDVGDDQKDITITITSTEEWNDGSGKINLADFKNNLLYVWIMTEGKVSESAPCGSDNPYTLGITYYTPRLYQSSLQLIGDLGCNCNIPKAFIDFVLKIKALQASILAGSYSLAKRYWLKFFTKLSPVVATNKCNCHD